MSPSPPHSRSPGRRWACAAVLAACLAGPPVLAERPPAGEGPGTAGRTAGGEPPLPLTLREARRDCDGDYVPDLLGRRVVVSGILTSEPRTAAPGVNVSALQDHTGGIALFAEDPGMLIGAYRLGDRIRVTGRVGQYKGTEWVELEAIERLGPGEAPPARDVLVADLLGEEHSGELVRVAGELLIAPDFATRGTPPLLRDRSGEIPIYLPGFFFNNPKFIDRLMHGGQLELVGIASQLKEGPPFDSAYRLFPRDPADFTFAPVPPYRRIAVGSLACLTFAALLYLWIRRQAAERRAQQMPALTEALRASEALYQATFEHAAVGIAHVGLDGRWLRVNQRLCEITGYSPEELLQRWFQDLTHPDEEGEDAAVLQSILSDRIQSHCQEKRCIRRDGGATWVNLTRSLLRGSSGEPQHFIIVMEEITERKRLEEQFLQAQKMEAVGRLAGGVAHDFNNMLAVINGYSDLLLSRTDLDRPMRVSLREVKRAGERAANLTRQLLAFSRKQIVTLEVLDLNELVTGLEEMLRRLIGEDIDLLTRHQPGAACVRADRGQIEQVLMNLIVNARDAMPRGGKLTLSVEAIHLCEDYARLHADVRPGRYVMLAVADSGTGMDEETVSHLFEPFFTTKAVGKGTGLGLATVYGIVKQLGGHVAVYSKLDEGTTMKVYLPQAEVTPRREGPPPTEDTLPGGSETVLLVEDEEMVRTLAASVLRKRGYVVLEAARSEEALHLCERNGNSIDLLFTDVVMPGRSNGRELAGRLSARHPEMKVLFTSGYTSDTVVHHGVLVAEMPFIQKPYTMDALARKVREVLDRGRPRPGARESLPAGPGASGGPARLPGARAPGGP